MLSTIGDALLAGTAQAFVSGFADLVSSSVVFVVRGHVPDAGVPNRVVFDPYKVELGGEEDPGVVDGLQVGQSCLTWPKKLSMWAWSVGVWGRPVCIARACSAMNSRVVPEIICGPLSDTASSTGSSSSALGAIIRCSMSSRSPSSSSARV